MSDIVQDIVSSSKKSSHRPTSRCNRPRHYFDVQEIVFIVPEVGVIVQELVLMAEGLSLFIIFFLLNQLKNFLFFLTKASFKSYKENFFVFDI